MSWVHPALQELVITALIRVDSGEKDVPHLSATPDDKGRSTSRELASAVLTTR